MKRMLVLLLLLLLIPCSLALAETEGAVLLSVFENHAWGDEIRAVVVDADGRAIEYDITETNVSANDPEAVHKACLTSNKPIENDNDLPALEVDVDALRQAALAIKSEDLMPTWLGANDFGVLRRYAAQPQPDGSTNWVTLSISGDVVMENIDENAQWLNAILCEMMPISNDDLQPQACWPTDFTYSFGSFNGGWYDYKLSTDESGIRLIAAGSNGVQLDVDCAVDPLAMGKLHSIIMRHKIDEWNGFSDRDSEILDGYSFNLELRRTTNAYAECIASGYERYPDGYAAAHAELADFLQGLCEAAN